MTNPAPSAPAHSDPFRTPWELVILLGAITATMPLAIDMYLPALLDIDRSFGAKPGSAGVTVATFMIGLAFGQLFYGPLSDRIGRRPTLIIGFTVYCVATVGCALAASMSGLVAARLLQGLGGCAAGVIPRAVVADRFTRDRAVRVFATMMMISGAAPMLAPVIGSGILKLGDWRTIMWVLFAIGAVTLLAIIFRLKESRSTQSADQARSESPLASYAAALKNPTVLGYSLILMLTSAAQFAFISGSPAVLMGVFGLSQQTFAWIFGGLSGLMIVSAQFASRLLKQHSSERILSVCLPICAVSGVLVLVSAATGLGLAGMLAGLAGFIAMMGLTVPHISAMAMSADPIRAGAVSAILGACIFGAGSLSAMLLGTLHSHSAIPLATTICLPLICAFLVFSFGPHRRRRAVQQA